MEIAKHAIDHARRHGNDLVFLDTAGRLHIDEALMDELRRIKAETEPAEILLVVDAMTGQDAVNAAAAFDEALGITGVMLTKLDGDARGGAALSVKAVTGKPIKFAGVGEKLDAIEVFHPDRMASRILGMGDVLTLIERRRPPSMRRKPRSSPKSSKEPLHADRLSRPAQLHEEHGLAAGARRDGAGAGRQALAGAKIDEKAMAHTEAIILSMTPAERENPSILNSSRKRRITAGAGVGVVDINRLLKQFEMMQTMARQLSGKKMKRFQRGGGKMPFGF